MFALFVVASLWIRGHQQEHPLLQLGVFFGGLVIILLVQHWKGEPRSSS
jgi:hypothetical protein